jgi:hypothetical protein
VFRDVNLPSDKGKRGGLAVMIRPETWGSAELSKFVWRAASLVFARVRVALGGIWAELTFGDHF